MATRWTTWGSGVAVLASTLSCRAPEVAPAPSPTKSDLQYLIDLMELCREEPTPLRTPADAEARLLSTNVFTTANMSLGGDWPPSKVRAFNMILDSPSAADSIERLVSSPKAAARCYGVCGLYFVAPERYLPELEKLRSLDGNVLLTDGCVHWGPTYSQIVDLILARSMPESFRSARMATASWTLENATDDDAKPSQDADSGK
jgi:hypothetical protein